MEGTTDMRSLSDAVIEEASADELRTAPLPETYLAAHLRAEDVDMFAGVQDKDEKTAQGGAMTRQQAEQEMEQLRKVFPSVRMLTAEQVQAGEAVGDAARQALEEKTTHSRMEYRGQELYEVTALFAQVEGTPCVLELERRLDRIMLLDPEESEQLFNNLAEYRGKLYRDAVTGAYNERYYQEKYRSRILTAGVAVLRVDDFKAANDVYGRYAGNSVLETVAGVLRRNDLEGWTKPGADF